VKRNEDSQVLNRKFKVGLYSVRHTEGKSRKFSKVRKKARLGGDEGPGGEKCIVHGLRRLRGEDLTQKMESVELRDHEETVEKTNKCWCSRKGGLYRKIVKSVRVRETAVIQNKNENWC